MGDQRTNRYRSGAKNPHIQTFVTKLEDDSLVVHVADWAKGRIVRFDENPKVDGVSSLSGMEGER